MSRTSALSPIVPRRLVRWAALACAAVGLLLAPAHANAAPAATGIAASPFSTNAVQSLAVSRWLPTGLHRHHGVVRV